MTTTRAKIEAVRDRLRSYNPPDRTVDDQRQIAQDIADAAALLDEWLRAEPVAWGVYWRDDDWKGALAYLTSTQPENVHERQTLVPLYAAPPAAPEGYVLVPVEPTPTMVFAGGDAVRENGGEGNETEQRGDAIAAYRAMLAAAISAQEDRLVPLYAAPPAAPEGWTKVGDQGPAPHERYLVRRNGVIFTAVPCYGMHAPWWVVQIMGPKREADPVDMMDTDEWRTAAKEGSNGCD